MSAVRVSGLFPADFLKSCGLDARHAGVNGGGMEDIMEMELVHLNVGWKSKNFTSTIKECCDVRVKRGFAYFDIKISSSSEDCLVIFKHI